MDVATLGLKVDSRQLRTATGEMETFTRAGKRADVAAQRVTTTTERMGQGYARAARAIAAATGAIAAASAALRASQQYTQITNSFRAMGQSAEEAAKTLERVAQVAQRTRSPLEATAQLYQRISIAGRDLGASQKEVLRFTENIGLALAQTGTSASQASGALLQLSQAMSGGIVRAEEFNSILEGAFPIAQAAADGIEEAAGSVGKLRQMVIEGKVSSDEFFNAILSQTAQLEAAFANTTPTISQAFRVLLDQLTVFIGRLDAATGPSAAIAQAILLIADNVARLATYALTAATILGARFVAALVAAQVATMSLAGAMAFLRGALIRTGFGALIVGVGEMVYQFGRLVEATGGWGEALNLLGEVAAGVWSGIKTSAQAIAPALEAIWQTVRAAFFAMLEEITLAWSRFLGGLGADLAGIPGLDAFSDRLIEKSGQAVAEMSRFNAQATAAESAAKRLNAEASALAEQGFEEARAAVEKLQAKLAELEKTGGETSDVSEQLDKALKDLGGASGGAKKAKDKIEEATTAAEGLNKALNDAVKSSAEMGSAFGGILVSGIDSFANAFGDLLTGGFKSFKDFASSIVDTFRQMLSQMIAMALKNQILISLGFSADGGLTGGNGLGGIFGGGKQGGGLFGAGGLFGKGGTLATLFSKGGLAKIFSGGFMSGIGALLPIAGLALGAFSLLKGAFSRKYYGSGIQGSIGGGGAENLYEFDFFKGGAFKSSKAVIRDLNSEIERFVNTSVVDMTDSIRNMAEVLGLSAEGIEDIEGGRFTIWTNGKSPEEIQEALTAEILKVGDAMAELVLTTDEFSKEGESALDTLTRLSTSLAAVNDMFALLERTTYSASLASGDLASKITEAFGGVEAFTAATSNFYDLFFTDAEKMADLTARTAAVFADFHEAMPTTREEYRAMVTAIDLTTERGREMYAAFIGLASAMDQILPTLDAVGELVGALIGRTTSVVDDMINHARDTAREAQNAARLWFTAADRIDAFLSGFNATAFSTISPQRRTLEASRSFERILEQIKDGQVDNAADLPNAAREFLSAAAASATTLAEYRRAESRVRNQMELARGISQFEGGAEEVIAHAAERQVEVLQELRDYLQSAEVIKPKDLRKFERELKSLDVAIASVRDLTFNSLQDRIDLVIRAANRSNLPREIKELLKGAAGGIRRLIDVTLRSDELSPAMKFIVLNGESAHVATLKMLIKDPLPPKLMRAILNESIDLTRQIIFTIKRENLPRDILQFALVEFANIRRRINLAVKERDPNAIRLALMESDSIRRIFQIAVNEGRLTDQQKSLLRAITGSNFNRVMLEGGFTFDPSRAFSNWFDRTTRGNIERPMDRLGRVIGELIDAVRKQTAAAEIRARASALNEFVDANLIQDAEGRHFADRRQLLKMAEIAGVDTSKYYNSRGGVRIGEVDRDKTKLKRATAGLADYDLLERVNYDPGQHKRRRFEAKQNEEDRVAGLSQLEVDRQLMQQFGGGAARIEVAQAIFDSVSRNGKLPGTSLSLRDYDNLQEYPGDHPYAAFNDYYEERPHMKAAMGLRMRGIINYMRNQYDPLDERWMIDRSLPPELYTPQFARGGMHFGGMRLVGEEGPELEVTGPSRIYSAGQTRNMLDNSAVVAELKMLRQEVADLRDENTQLLIRQNRHAKRTTDTLEKWDAIGLPQEQT